MNLSNLFKKNNAKEKNNSENNFSDFCQKTILFLENNSWIFTVVFLGMTFFASLWVWWKCIYNPQPSDKVLEEFKSSRKSYQALIKEIKGGIIVLEEKRKKLDECSSFNLQKNIFVSQDEAEWIFDKGKIENQQVLLEKEGDFVEINSENEGGSGSNEEQQNLLDNNSSEEQNLNNDDKNEEDLNTENSNNNQPTVLP